MGGERRGWGGTGEQWGIVRGQAPPEAPVRLEPRPRPLKIEKQPSGRRVGALLTSGSGGLFHCEEAPSPDESHVSKGEMEAQRNVATVEVSHQVGDRIGI